MENLFEIYISFSFLLALLFLYYFHDKNGFPTNWPVVGMLPGLLMNVHRMHDYFVEALAKAQLSFLFKGPWLTNMELLATADPANVHYVMSSNFANYPKGDKFKAIFDILGDGFANADSPTWEYHRKRSQSFLGHAEFHQLLISKVVHKLKNGLVPVLDHFCKQRTEVDLQDLFKRFTSDLSIIITMDFDPNTLSIDLPRFLAAEALHVTEAVIFYRHALPTFVWKLQRWLNIGLEKKYKQGWKILDDFIHNCINIKRSQLLEMSKNSSPPTTKINKMSSDLLTLYMDENDQGNKDDDKFLRDTALNFFVAASSGTAAVLAWFFYLLSKNPHVETKIRAELVEFMMSDRDPIEDLSTNSRELFNKLIYLHAALCETLRLYPPVAYEAKSPAKHDVLPSGHQVTPNTQIIIGMATMGRMKSIWGDDCCEFKPERWITEKGKIKHEPSYKFVAFNSGPRTCVGKDMAFTQMKSVAITVLRNYRIQVVEGIPIVPEASVILRIKHGLRVKVVRLQQDHV